MAHTNENALYPRVALQLPPNSASAVSGQALTITGTTTASFAAFQSDTKHVFFDVQGADVICTLDGTNPVILSRGHRFAALTNYTWNASVAKGAKFVSTGTSSFLFLQELGI